MGWVVLRPQPEDGREAKRLYRASPKTAKHRSLRSIASARAKAGYLNRNGRPFNSKSIRSMLKQ